MNTDKTPPGLNLHIDSSIDDLCKSSNISGTYARRLISVLMLMTALAVIAVWNTCARNWANVRLTNGVRDYHHWKMIDSLARRDEVQTPC